MQPQHLLAESSERQVTCLATGQSGTLLVQVVHQARGKEQNSAPSFRVLFTADDAYQEWDEEDQEYDRCSVGAEFSTREALDDYVASHYGAC